MATEHGETTFVEDTLFITYTSCLVHSLQGIIIRHHTLLTPHATIIISLFLAEIKTYTTCLPSLTSAQINPFSKSV